MITFRYKDKPYNIPLSQEVWSMTPGLNYWSPGCWYWVAPSQALFRCRGGEIKADQQPLQCEMEKQEWQVKNLLVYWKMHFASPSLPSAALTKTQKVQLVPGVSCEISALSPARVLFWEPQLVDWTRYVYSFLYPGGFPQNRRTVVVFKVSAFSHPVLWGPTHGKESVTFENSNIKHTSSVTFCQISCICLSTKVTETDKRLWNNDKLNFEFSSLFNCYVLWLFCLFSLRLIL